MKTYMFCLVMSFIFTVLPAQETSKTRLLKKEQAIELAKMLAREDVFLEGPDVKFAPETIGKFFKKEVYEQMRGNPFMGYYFEEGGRYVGSKTKTIWIDIIAGLSGTKPWHNMIRQAMEKLAETKGYVFDSEAPNRLGFYVIQVHPEKTKTSHPGIVVEMYIQNRDNGTVLYTRQYEGDLKGPESAVVTVCDYMYFLIEHEMKDKRE